MAESLVSDAELVKRLGMHLSFEVKLSRWFWLSKMRPANSRLLMLPKCGS